jgi:hypothetical protein
MKLHQQRKYLIDLRASRKTVVMRISVSVGVQCTCTCTHIHLPKCLDFTKHVLGTCRVTCMQPCPIEQLCGVFDVQLPIAARFVDRVNWPKRAIRGLSCGGKRPDPQAEGGRIAFQYWAAGKPPPHSHIFPRKKEGEVEGRQPYLTICIHRDQNTHLDTFRAVSSVYVDACV